MDEKVLRQHSNVSLLFGGHENCRSRRRFLWQLWWHGLSRKRTKGNVL